MTKNKITINNKTSLIQLFKQAVQGKTKDFTQGSIGKAAFLLAVPMVLEMVMESIFAITDIFFVAGLGSQAIAVVGLTEAVLTLLYAVAIGLSMAVTATIARRIGEKNTLLANQIAGQTLWLGVIVAVIISFIGINYSEQILAMMGATDSLIEQGKSYTSIMLGGSISILYLFLINAIFRGAGDASTAMKSLWLANGINIVLDPLLIYGVGPFPEMGLAGAAVATTIGRSIGVIYQLNYLFKLSTRIKVGFQELAFNSNVCLKLIKVSTGGVVQFLIATASWIALVRIISTYGSAAVAGYTIAIRVVMFTILPAWGLSNAVATLVGQNLGAGKAERAEQSVWKIAKYNVYFLLSVALLFLIFTQEIVGIFTQDKLVLHYASDTLRFISYSYGFFAIGMIVVQAFNGAGDTMTPTKINFFCYWLVQIPLAYLLAKGVDLGPTGVFLAITLSQSLLAFVGIIIFRKGDWKLKQI